METKANDYDRLLAIEKLSERTKNDVRKCKQQNLKDCLFYLDEIKGSAFLDRDPHYIWTNCHIVRTWMKKQSQNQTFDNRSKLYSYYQTTELPLRLTNNEGKAIYTSDEKSSAVLTHFSPESSDNKLLGTCSQRDDLVKLYFPIALADDGLEWDKMDLEDQQQLFLGGYPKETQNRAQFGGTDSSGKRFHWTTGPFLKKKGDAFNMFLNQNPNTGFVINSVYSGSFYGDSINGMSGGPVLNSNGRVVGIYQSYIPKSKEEKDIPKLSLFTTTSGMRFLEILSE